MADRDFDSLSPSEQEAKRTEMFQTFRYGSLKDEDIPLFIDQFNKGMIILNAENDDFEKMAAIIGSLQKVDTLDTQTWKMRRGRLNAGIKSTRNLKEWGLRRQINKMKKLEADNRLANLKLEQKFKGPSEELAQVYDSKSAAWSTLALNNRYIPKFVGNLAARYYDNKAKEARQDPNLKLKTRIQLRANEIERLEKEVSNSRFFEKIGAKIKLGFRHMQQDHAQKKLIRRMRLDELSQKSEKLNAEIAAVRTELSNAGTKTAQKLLTSKLRTLEGQAFLADARSSKLGYDYGEQKKSLDESFAVRSMIVSKEITARRDKIEHKNQLLDKSTFRGNALDKLTRNLPEERRKSLEEIANSRYQENATPDSEFISYLENKGFKEDEIKIIRGSMEEVKTGHRPQQTINANESEDNTHGQINDGESDAKPADDKLWHQESQKNLDDSFRDYEKIDPHRDGTKNSENENVLYNSYEKDNHIITIEKANPDTYDVSAKDADGSEKTPSVEDMKNVIESLKKDGHDKMELGNVNTPEFYANTVIAAKECGLEISNAKEMSEQMKEKFGENWLEKLPPQTKEAFEKATTPTINDAQAKTDEKTADAKTTDEKKDKTAEEQKTAPQEKTVDAQTANGPQGPEEKQPTAEQPATRPEDAKTGGQNETNAPAPETQQFSDHQTIMDSTAAAAKFKGNNDAIKKMDLLANVSDMDEAKFSEFQQSADYKKLSAEQRSIVNGLHKLKNNKEFANQSERKQAVMLGRLVGQYKSSVERETQKGKNSQTAKRDFVKNNMSQYIPKNSGRE